MLLVQVGLYSCRSSITIPGGVCSSSSSLPQLPLCHALPEMGHRETRNQRGIGVYALKKVGLGKLLKGALATYNLYGGGFARFLQSSPWGCPIHFDRKFFYA
jgi:hypothetical protein